MQAQGYIIRALWIIIVLVERPRQSPSYDRISRHWNYIPAKVTFQITNCNAENELATYAFRLHYLNEFSSNISCTKFNVIIKMWNLTHSKMQARKK
jgi:hypothetical protein